jgi:hypothetical protein
MEMYLLLTYIPSGVVKSVAFRRPNLALLASLFPYELEVYDHDYHRYILYFGA